MSYPPIQCVLTSTASTTSSPAPTGRQVSRATSFCRSIVNSLPFGLYAPSGQQAGFARVVTDRATYAYLGDVYVETDHRARGLGKFLVSCVLAHPQLQGLRRWALATADAHDLYARQGFRPSANPEIHMFIEQAPADLWSAPIGQGTRQETAD
jgi:GNAT superfamily N-acetyltransferase